MHMRRHHACAILAGQRIALYSLPTLCFGVGCSEPGLALSHWTLAGTVSTPLPAPLRLPHASDLFPAVFSDAAAVSAVDAATLDVYRVSMEAIPGDSGTARCDAATELCGHRWLGSAGPAIVAQGLDSVQRVYAAELLDSRGTLVEADAAAAPELAATAPALVDAVLVEEETGDARTWRLVVAAMAVVCTSLVAVMTTMWAAQTFNRLHAAHSDSGDSSSMSSDSSDSSGSPRPGKRGKPVPYAWALHPRALVLAACSPIAILAAAAGVSAATVSSSGSTVAAGAGIAGLTAPAIILSLLCAAAAAAYTWRLQSRVPSPLLPGADGSTNSRAETLTPSASSVPVADGGGSVGLHDETVTEEQAAESLSAAAFRASMVLRQVNPNPGRVQHAPRSTATADGSSSLFVTNLELSRFFDGGEGGHLVEVSIPAHGGGVVADAGELVSPREPLRVRTQMDPAMRVAENLSAANLHFVELLRGKYLLPQLQATALRAANMVALRENVVPANSSEGEICKVRSCCLHFGPACHCRCVNLVMVYARFNHACRISSMVPSQCFCSWQRPLEAQLHIAMP